MNMDDDIEFLRVAYRVAISTSDDQTTQNGAAIVFNGRIISTGANCLPRAVSSDAERLERPLKYSYIEHAERNAIYEAARLGRMTAGATLYCPWSACAECARAIIQAGIVRVVAHHAESRPVRADWRLSLVIAETMMREAGIKLDVVDVVFGIDLLFNGEAIRV